MWQPGTKSKAAIMGACQGNRKQAGIEPATNGHCSMTDYSVLVSVALWGVLIVHDHALDVRAVSNCHIRTATLTVVLT